MNFRLELARQDENTKLAAQRQHASCAPAPLLVAAGLRCGAHGAQQCSRQQASGVPGSRPALLLRLSQSGWLMGTCRNQGHVKCERCTHSFKWKQNV